MKWLLPGIAGDEASTVLIVFQRVAGNRLSAVKTLFFTDIQPSRHGLFNGFDGRVDFTGGCAR
ncbi:hypothetical protein D3C75_1290130 [compost metagenome]